MKCDIIVVSWNYPDVTRACLEHLLKNTRYPFRLIIVDNASEQKTVKYLENLKNASTAEIVVFNNGKNLGFVKAVNRGLRFSDAPYVCIFNNDTLPGEGWLKELIGFAEKHPDIGLLNPVCGGHIQSKMTVNEYARELSGSNKGRYMEMNQCQGFCMLVKREVLDKIGILDEQFDTVGFDDTDYSRRAHLAGYRCACVLSSYVYHKEHESFGRMGNRKKIQSVLEEKYFKKWPRHKRIAFVFAESSTTTDGEIKGFLNLALSLAREWCWMNLFIYGDKSAKNRIETLKEAIKFPLHQNLKFNYLNGAFKKADIAVRMLERSFGNKRRKKYDAVVCNDGRLLPFLKFLSKFQKYRVFKENQVPSEWVAPDKKPLESHPNKCDIIIPVCDQYEFTKKCIESIMEKTDSPYRLIIINNGRNPKTRAFLDGLEKNEKIETAIVHNRHNIGWVKALNKGMEISNAPYICFQNDDTIVTQSWLRKMINILELDESFGLINPQWEGRPPNISIDGYNAKLEKNSMRFMFTDWCRGFSVVLKRAVMEKIGRVDEIYGLAYFDDVDYSVQATENGFLCLRALDTYVYHKRNVTFFEILKGKKWNELHEKNKLIYHKKWGRPLKIVIILGRKICNDKDALDKVESSVFSLARKQHHIKIWSPRKLTERFRYTNIKIKTAPPILFNALLLLDLYMNKKKSPEKRYDAVFDYRKQENIDKFNMFIVEKVNKMKEKTKEKAHV